MLEDKYQAELTLEREEFYKALQKAQEALKVVIGIE